MPSSALWASSSAGAAQAASASRGGLAELLLSEVTEGLLHHLLLVVRSEVEQPDRFDRGWRAGLPSFCAAAKLRPAALAARKPLRVPR